MSDAEWALLAPRLPPPAPCGRLRKWPERLVADAVFYVLRSGCAWRMLPRDFPPGRLPCIAGQPAWANRVRTLPTLARERDAAPRARCTARPGAGDGGS